MSIDYYNRNAQDFIERTMDLDVSVIADRFLAYVTNGGSILDLGCGPGRDALYFKAKGYDVYGLDGSEALVSYAKRLLGDKISLSTFEAYKNPICFDGIWAMASLIHVFEKDMTKMVSKYKEMLKPDGIFYMSFKKYKENFVIEDRFFTCYEIDSLEAMIKEVKGLDIIELFESSSIKEGHEEEKWVNVLCKRIR